VPYGQPGDRLWVRETWARNWNQLSDISMDRSYVYRADGETRAQNNGTDLPWKPGIHMPRAASRILLEVTGVRVERLQDISEKDACAEGTDPIRAKVPTHRDAFRYLWESINGVGSWASNTWVWVIDAARVYFNHYCKDDAAMDGPEWTGCSEEEHLDAAELGGALASLPPPPAAKGA